ncbi:hypothetical protein [Pseudoxanthomonas winnipegensis]|uniref:hypothetical protein n=1 Tax=Pseudoxanthomonas winnipegensis TaxID=2480810 RepID=UPI00103B7733|nr:hypothetical protein [Pseudoxanthomonas winnipegensis]TBV69369.1 hypothetical protein EYC45_19595 [Pseudoxanthomonas winnipegensis]
MKAMIFAVITLVFSSAAQAANEAERLSRTPEVVLTDNMCHIRGAAYIQGKGPHAGQQIALVDKAGATRLVVTTDEDGIYTADISVADGGVVLMEKEHDTGMRASLRKSAQVKRYGGPIRTNFAPTIVCGRASVSVGDIEQGV